MHNLEVDSMVFGNEAADSRLLMLVTARFERVF